MTRSSKDFPYVFYIPHKKNHWEADAWCRQHFGERWSVVDNRQGVWCCFWRGFRSQGPGHYEWLFENERDALLFALRWS